MSQVTLLDATLALLDGTLALLNARLEFLASDQASAWAEAQDTTGSSPSELLSTIKVHTEASLVELANMRQFAIEDGASTDPEASTVGLSQDGLDYVTTLHQQALSGNIALGIAPEIEPSAEDEALLVSIEASVAKALIVFGAAVSYEASDEGIASREASMQAEIESVMAALQSETAAEGIVLLSGDDIFGDDAILGMQAAIAEGSIIDLSNTPEIAAAIEVLIPMAPPATEVVAILTDLASNVRTSFRHGELITADLEGIAASVTSMIAAQQTILTKAGLAIDA